MLKYYLRLGWKSMRRNPVMSGLMVMALGLGIAAFMTTYTVYYLMSGNPIPHKSEQLFAVQLDNWDPNRPPTESAQDVQPQITFRDGDYLMHAETPATQQVLMYAASAIVQPEGENDAPFDGSIRATYRTFFDMFDVPFLYGQAWDESDDEQRRKIVVLSREMNETLFGGEDSVGETVRMNDTLFQVVGVIDYWQPTPRFYHVDVGRFSNVEDFFTPFGVGLDMVLMPNGNTNCWLSPDGAGVEAFLRSECVWVQFWAELNTADQKLAYHEYLNNFVESQKELGRYPRPTKTYISSVMEWMDVNQVVRDDNRVLVRVAFLFLLVCILNTVGLLLAKFLGKAPEVALRRAMGASTGDVFRQNLVEVSAIGLMGGVVGIILSWFGLMLIEKLYRGYQNLVHLDLTMLIAALAIALLSAIIAGLYPVYRVSRLSPAGLLKTQ